MVTNSSIEEPITESSDSFADRGNQTCSAWPRKVSVFGLGVSVTDYDSAVHAIQNAATERRPASISCHAVHAIVEFTGDPDRTRRLRDFEMITPDGQPVRWAMNLLHRTGLRDRVYGPELTLRTCRMAAENRFPVFFYGASEATLESLSRNLREACPGLEIAGSISPPFRDLSDAEVEAFVDQINTSGARILFVGLGCPKQDLFVADNRESLKPVQICVGAAFDFHAGNKPIAPAWMQKSGLEWVFRLCCEPRRLFARYATTNTIFVLRVIKQFLAGPKKGQGKI